jgi:hypothetical protein
MPTSEVRETVQLCATGLVAETENRTAITPGGGIRERVSPPQGVEITGRWFF